MQKFWVRHCCAPVLNMKSHCILILRFWCLENLLHFNFVDVHSSTTTLHSDLYLKYLQTISICWYSDFSNLTSSCSPVGPLCLFEFLGCMIVVYLCMFCFTLTNESFPHSCFGAGVTDLNELLQFVCFLPAFEMTYFVSGGTLNSILTHARRNKMHAKI